YRLKSRRGDVPLRAVDERGEPGGDAVRILLDRAEVAADFGVSGECHGYSVTSFESVTKTRAVSKLAISRTAMTRSSSSQSEPLSEISSVSTPNTPPIEWQNETRRECRTSRPRL